MMSNTGATAFGNGLQQHNLTAATIDYLNHNGAASMATYPTMATPESTLMLDKQSTATFYAPSANPTAYYSTQLVAQAPGTILITNNFGPDESSTISGVNNTFANSSIRIVTHNNNNSNNNNNNNNNNQHKNNNNNNNSCGSKLPSLEETNFSLNSDKQPHQSYHNLHHLQHTPPTAMPAIAMQHSPSSSLPNPVMPNSLLTRGPSTGPQTNTSTVVLDRINICINNHYGDATSIPTAASGTLPNVGLHSPIIPPIVNQKTTIIDTCAPMMKQMETDTASILDMHIDEPDSTTSTHCHSDLAPMEQMEQDNPTIEQETEDHEVDMEKSVSDEDIAVQSFEIGEDALVKRRDGRFYLGTIVCKHRQQYLMQFDDKTDYWSNVDELTKLSGNIKNNKMKPRCLRCKIDKEEDVVETCDRCGRGYHRKCTDEVSPGSGQYMCKRCAKPMKYSLEDQPVKNKTKKAKTKKVIKRLPYVLEELTWDEKHRVNIEKIYCYCGKSGQFDNKMIQCCKCKQWFHADCLQSPSLQSIFRGDVFYLFGCLLCNNGKEFLRRVEIKWDELVHLLLYNLTIMKNFQKYHHLQREIYPFALKNRQALRLPKAMLDLSDTEFKNELFKTLQSNQKLFFCGKELKKEFAVWSLRVIKPPQGPSVDIKKDEVLCDKLIKEKFNINILPRAVDDDEKMDVDNSTDERNETLSKSIQNIPTTRTESKNSLKVGKPLIDDDDDDDKFTSDDEIPIKQILEQVKSESSNMQDLSDPLTELLDQIIPEQETSALTSTSKPTDNKKTNDEKEKKDIPEECPVVKPQQQKSSRKRKAFTLSKGYKDSEKSNNLPRNICDSSSDENSSSSRGTLDLIIPPPKNFLGLNNPFRMVTPKKSDPNATNASSKNNNSGYTKKSVSFGSNSIFTSTLDLNSKIAALKSSGLFPNISNSDIAKAAGQPRLVRTIKRRLSAKDIMIGPNQEVRRRRTRPLSSNVEVISTTTINQIPSNFFPIRAPIPESIINTTINSKATTSSSQPSISPNNTSSSQDSVPQVTVATHGRRLRKRPEKTSPQNSRRNSISSSSSSNSYTGSTLAPPPSSQSQSAVPLTDLKLSVNKYFGAANRIENGEQFTIRAKRRTPSGHTQYLIEWES